MFIYPGSEPDGYIVMNSKLAYHFTSSISSYFAVNNITNKQYEEIERYRMEGRSFSVGANFSF